MSSQGVDKSTGFPLEGGRGRVCLATSGMPGMWPGAAPEAGGAPRDQELLCRPGSACTALCAQRGGEPALEQHWLPVSAAFPQNPEKTGGFDHLENKHVERGKINLFT